MLQSEHMLSDKRHCFHKILLLEPNIRILDLDLELGLGFGTGRELQLKYVVTVNSNLISMA